MSTREMIVNRIRESQPTSSRILQRMLAKLDGFETTQQNVHHHLSSLKKAGRLIQDDWKVYRIVD